MTQNLNLPNPTNDQEYDQIDFRGEPFLQAAVRICELEDIVMGNVKTFKTGSSPVFGVSDQHIIKMYAPLNIKHFEMELNALRFLQQNEFKYGPDLRAFGTVAGWSYIVMQKISGQSLTEVWEHLSPQDKINLMLEFGKIVKDMHGLPTKVLKNESLPWSEFINQQRQNVMNRHTRLGLVERFLKEIPSFLKNTGFRDQQLDSFLHTELMRDHVFVSMVDGQWKISGLIDFEPSMIGDPEYDFASVGIFVCMGEPSLFLSFLSGYCADLQDQNRPYRVMAYAILHRYSNLNWFLKLLPNGDDLQDLARKWFT